MYTFASQECTFLIHKNVHSCCRKVYTLAIPYYCIDRSLNTYSLKGSISQLFLCFDIAESVL